MRTVQSTHANHRSCGKLNTDNNQQTAINYRIESIPTMIVFKGGLPVDRMMGLVPEARIADMLDRHVG